MDNSRFLLGANGRMAMSFTEVYLKEIRTLRPLRVGCHVDIFR
jgi:hypothetical protein